MLKPIRPALVVAALTALIVLVSGCSGTPAEAAPLNVAAINGIKAYHVKVQETIRLQNTTVDMQAVEDVIAPDRARAQMTAKSDGQTVTANTIAIGTQVWVKTDSDWREQTIDPSFRQAAVNAAMQICTAFKGLPARTETLQGQATVHYTTKGASTDALNDGFNQMFAAFSTLGMNTSDAHAQVQSADLWTTADGARPLRMKLKVAVTVNGVQATVDAQADYSDIDGGDIDIEPPL